MQKKSVFREISSCVLNRFNGYNILKIAKEDCVKSTFNPLDIVYDPVGDATKSIGCYFSENNRFVFHLQYSKGIRFADNKIRIDKSTPTNAILAINLMQQKKGHDSHVANCSQSAGIVYKFDHKSLISFEDNYHLLGDLPFVVYFDFERTAGRDLFQDYKKCTF